MKRFYIAPLLAIVVALIWVTGASADMVYHGNYTKVTYRCSACHRAHTAQGEAIIKTATAYDLCMACHEEVNDGVEVDATTGAMTPLRGGGFLNGMMNVKLDLTPPTTLTTTQSAHKVAGMTGYTGDILWGFGSSGAGTSFTLQCSTCHDPHGNSGANGASTWRILRGNIAAKVGGTGAAVTVAEPAAGASSIPFTIDTIANPSKNYYGIAYTQVLTDGSILGNKLSDWCQQCHTRIHTTDSTDPGGTPLAGDSIFTYRHPTNGNSVVDRFTTDTAFPTSGAEAPGCMSCHVSHGSTSVLGYSGSHGTASYDIPRLDGSPGFLDHSLLRLNGRGAAQACHNK